jgi:hypothetical protein
LGGIGEQKEKFSPGGERNALKRLDSRKEEVWIFLPGKISPRGFSIYAVRTLGDLEYRFSHPGDAGIGSALQDR